MRVIHVVIKQFEGVHSHQQMNDRHLADLKENKGAAIVVVRLSQDNLLDSLNRPDKIKEERIPLSSRSNDVSSNQVSYRTCHRNLVFQGMTRGSKVGAA